MAPLPAPEPFELLDTVEAVDARKIRFERNRIKLPMGVEATFGMIRHPGASLAVPITADGHVVLLRQYRFAVQARLLEFPAGTLEEGEDPLESMQRELGEEAGYSAARWDALGPMLPCPGYSDEVIHCFLARELTPLENPPAGDEDEDLEVVLMTPMDLDARLGSGDEWLDGKSVTAWYRAKQLLARARLRRVGSRTIRLRNQEQRLAQRRCGRGPCVRLRSGSQVGTRDGQDRHRPAHALRRRWSRLDKGPIMSRKKRQKGADGAGNADAFMRQLAARMEACPDAESLNDQVLIPFAAALENVCGARGYVLNIYGETSNIVFSGDPDDAEALYGLIDDYLESRVDNVS